MAREKTKAERLFGAAVVWRSFQLQDGQYREGFQFIWEGVLRDLGLEEQEVQEYLTAHREEVEAAIGRRGKAL